MHLTPTICRLGASINGALKAVLWFTDCRWHHYVFLLAFSCCHQFPLPCHLFPGFHICVSEHSWHHTFPNTTITSSINSPSRPHSRLLLRCAYPPVHWINIYPQPPRGQVPVSLCHTRQAELLCHLFAFVLRSSVSVGCHGIHADICLCYLPVKPSQKR